MVGKRCTVNSFIDNDTLTQREGWRRGMKWERQHVYVCIWEEEERRYCHNSCVSARLLGAQVAERLPRPGLINVKGDRSLNTAEATLAIWLSFKSFSCVSRSGIGHSLLTPPPETRWHEREKEECITNEINWLRGEINWFADCNKDLVLNLAWTLQARALAAKRHLKI